MSECYGIGKKRADGSTALEGCATTTKDKPCSGPTFRDLWCKIASKGYYVYGGMPKECLLQKGCAVHASTGDSNCIGAPVANLKNCTQAAAGYFVDAEGFAKLCSNVDNAASVTCKGLGNSRAVCKRPDGTDEGKGGFYHTDQAAKGLSDTCKSCSPMGSNGVAHCTACVGVEDKDCTSAVCKSTAQGFNANSAKCEDHLQVFSGEVTFAGITCDQMDASKNADGNTTRKVVGSAFTAVVGVGATAAFNVSATFCRSSKTFPKFKAAYQPPAGGAAEGTVTVGGHRRLAAKCSDCIKPSVLKSTVEVGGDSNQIAVVLNRRPTKTVVLKVRAEGVDMGAGCCQGNSDTVKNSTNCAKECAKDKDCKAYSFVSRCDRPVVGRLSRGHDAPPRCLHVRAFLHARRDRSLWALRALQVRRERAGGRVRHPQSEVRARPSRDGQQDVVHEVASRRGEAQRRRAHVQAAGRLRDVRRRDARHAGVRRHQLERAAVHGGHHQSPGDGGVGRREHH